MRKLAVLTIILVLVALSSSRTILVHGEINVDCGLLLALLNMELNHAVNYDFNSGKLLAQAVLDMSLPSEMASIHRQVYKAFLDYFDALEALSNSKYTNESILSMLRALIKSREVFTSSLNTYLNRLSSCTVNPETGSKLRNDAMSLTNILLNTIYPNLVQSILYELRGPEVISIDLPKSTFKPGEIISINITPLVDEVHIVKVEIAHWPTLRSLIRLIDYVYVDKSYLTTYRAPFLNEVYDQIVGKNIQLAVVATYILHNTTLSYAKFFEVTYDYPNVTINAPLRISYGDDLQLSVVSSDVYNFTVLVNNVRVLNATLGPGTNTYSIQFNATLFKIGYNNLRVIIDETPRTIRYTVDKSFLVEASTPRVFIQIPAVIVDWSNSFPVTIVMHNESRVNFTVFVNSKEVLNKKLEDQVYSFKVTLNSLFFTKLKIEAYVTNEHGIRVLISEKEALYINSLSTTILILAIILLASVFKIEPLILQGHGVAERKLLVDRKGSPRPLLESRITYSVKSKIASIYYSLLSGLGLPHPGLSETLREHYKKLRLKSSLANVIWRLLILVERDLYSNKKPSYDEAIEIAKKAEENAGN